MIITENTTRILTVSFKHDGYAHITSIRVNEDPEKVKLKQISLSLDEQQTLVEALIENLHNNE